MLVVVLIFAGAIAVGYLGARRYFPPLAPGRVGDICFYIVCSLVAVAVAVVALHAWEMVQEYNANGGVADAFPPGGSGFPDLSDIIAQDLTATMRDTGLIVGLAAAVYLLAPAGDE